MCGIAGFFGQRPMGNGEVEAMRAAIARRGPDAFHIAGGDAGGPFTANATGRPLQRALLHARLSIRDPRPCADQPMANGDGSVWLCYNGEVYGWEEDARYLESQGYPFATHSDTEFILRGYEHWGLDGLLPRLRGMFAFAIVDLRRGKVYCARDRLGLKPFLYYHDPKGREFAFASLVRGVLPYLPADRRNFDPEGIDAYLAHRTIPAPRTVFSHIRRLENGHCLEFDLETGALSRRRYWSPEPEAGDWRVELDRAIALRTVADRPVGVFLSSGVDSVVLASRLAHQGYTNIQTFTAGFSTPEMDESPRAAAIAARLGLGNRRIAIPDEAGGDFEAIVADLDEPFADPSSFPTWYLAREAVNEVKVVLCGDGGDELFGGYKRYRQHLRSAWRRHLPPLACLRPAPQVAPGKGERLKLEAALTWLDAYPLRFSGIGCSERAALQPDFHVRPHWWRLPEDVSRRPPLEQLLAIDGENYLPEYILRKADLLTMAHGLEARAPFLDHRFVEQVLAMPPAERFTSPAKKALAGVCPEAEEFARLSRKKMGFNPPVGRLLARLSSRLQGLPERLAACSGGQLPAPVLRQAVDIWEGDPGRGEQLLQLLILDESLAQLQALA
ncbi:MAG: asnB [Rhodocyclaceae bacterium]|nr:asnB [Rhodocyclaceae bacterium]